MNVDPTGREISLSSVAVAVAISFLVVGAATSTYNPIGRNTRGPQFGLWDVAVASEVYEMAAAVSTIVETKIKNRRRNQYEGHHTVPIYLCGADEQELSVVRVADHALIHAGLSEMEVLLHGAEEDADKLVPLGRRTDPDKIRFASSQYGRGVIAGAIGAYYLSEGWLANGKPPIGEIFPEEALKYELGKTSLPECQRSD